MGLSAKSPTAPGAARSTPTSAPPTARHPGGKVNNAAAGANRKDHDKYYGNFLFADAHVATIADTNRDGEFGWLSGSNPAPNAKYDDDIEGKVFGGILSAAADSSRQRVTQLTRREQ
jgi:prepilin-type processing-associated H-X9-DG protein